MHYCYNYFEMSWKNLYTFSPQPTPSIFQAMRAELQPFQSALCLKGLPPCFQVLLRFLEISGLPDDQESMSLYFSFALYLQKSLQMQSMTTAIFKLQAEPWCSDFNFKFTPGFCYTDLAVLTYSEAKDLLSGGHNVRLLSCLRTSPTLIHHLNQYGAVHGPKKEPWMRTATQT